MDRNIFPFLMIVSSLQKLVALEKNQQTQNLLQEEGRIADIIRAMQKFVYTRHHVYLAQI